MTEPGARDALIWTERGLVPLPESALGVPTDLDEIARWPGLSRRGRVRALADLVRKPRPPKADEKEPPPPDTTSESDKQSDTADPPQA